MAAGARDQIDLEASQVELNLNLKRTRDEDLRSREELEVARAGLQELERLRADRLKDRQRLEQETRNRELEIERRVRYAEERFKDEGGKESDRGSVYIAYGPPAEVESNPEAKFEIWRYREIPGVGRSVEFRFEGRPLKKVSGPKAKDK